MTIFASPVQTLPMAPLPYSTKGNLTPAAYQDTFLNDVKSNNDAIDQNKCL